MVGFYHQRCRQQMAGAFRIPRRHCEPVRYNLLGRGLPTIQNTQEDNLR